MDESAERFEDPDVQALLAASIAVSPPMAAGKGRLIIRWISTKQRPRR